MRHVFMLCLLIFPCIARAQIDEPPQLQHEVPAAYPPRALAERLEASVLFTIDIDAAGRVSQVELVAPSSAPGYGFEEAAEAAIRQFVFIPAKAAGEAVPVRVQYRYRFVLPAQQVSAGPEPPETPPTEARPAAVPRPSGQLTGTVIERGTRSPLPGALVTIRKDAEAFEAVSDQGGRFAFYDLSPGSWTLNAEIQGYLASRGAERVAAGEQTDVRIYLERSADNPYDVLVEGDVPKREVTRRRLSAREAETQPGTFGDPLLAVENLPGMAIVPFDASSISMRGAASDESTIYIEGFRVPSFFHFIGLRSVIAPGMLESVDLYPGGAPVNYGRQVGGVLQANLKRSQPDRAHGYVDISLLDAGLFLELPVGDKVSIALAGRVSYLDRIMQAFDSPMPRYDDYQLMISARPTAAHQLRLIYLGWDDWFRLDTEGIREESAQVTFGTIASDQHVHHVAIEHGYTPSTRVQQRARVGYLYWTSQTDLGDDAGFGATYHALLVRDALRYAPAAWLSAELGIDAELGRWGTDVLISQPPKEGEPEGYTDVAADLRAHDEGIDHRTVGGWLGLELTPVESLSIAPGVRADVQPQIERITVDPRISARYAPIEQFALKAGTGVHHGPPTLDEVSPPFGNADLRAERALQHSAGFELLPLPFLRLDVTAFYHQFDRLAARSDRVKLVDGEAVPLEYENTGEGRAYGLEVMLRQQLAHRLSGWIAYTLARTERRRIDDEAFRLFDFDQTHSLALVAAYQLPRHFQLSTRFRYRTGRPTTPIVGASFVSDTDEYAPRFGPTNSSRLTDFHQLDIRLDKRWVFDRWSFTAYLDVQNVYNRNNAIDLTYRYDYAERAKVKSLPVLAILGFKAAY